jgi:hypothetical protein
MINNHAQIIDQSLKIYTQISDESLIHYTTKTKL